MLLFVLSAPNLPVIFMIEYGNLLNILQVFGLQEKFGFLLSLKKYGFHYCLHHHFISEIIRYK